MAAETIVVYIDTAQLALQKQNNYSLYLAKKVNGQFTVIWQSFGPLAVAGNPGYVYRNTFTIAVPNYGVNYGTVTTTGGSVTFQGSGDPVSISIGQTVDLSALGIFGTPTNTGTPGDIIITNELQDNPHVILLDDAGNPIFVDAQSGMDPGGPATLTPIDTYQIWFDNFQDTGTIISHQTSAIATVVFDGGTTEKIISFTSAGTWEDGPLPSGTGVAALGAGTPGDFTIAVLATFKYALTAGMATYLVSKLIDKFTAGLRPKKITAQAGSASLQIEFQGPEAQRLAVVHGLSKFEDAVNLALKQAKADSASGLQKETWTISEPSVTASY